MFKFTKNGNIEFAIIEAELDPALVEYENLEINFWQDDELIVATSDKNSMKKNFISMNFWNKSGF